ncbi:MAG: transglutaminase domain-containing protein, partial [Gammaproteobacteria bacterium]|nr:transglutaminase domain-containing protein [Gammaproteobacteria bacterium]
LPFKSAKPNPDNKPKLNKESFTSNGYFNSPQTQLAALGDFTYSNLSGADNPAYLAASDEIQLSQSIKDQAAALNYNTAEIYHWVRNNIQWQPTWGAVQNAELTLDAKRGNAMDIASLTIALLRASQIPARYVHGTIDIPEANFRNWAGGFSSIDAAITFAASGSIPVIAMTQAGKINAVRMEHIWVEVATDYLPSRAAINIDADSWLPIDPSYKQYDYLQGLDVVQIAGTNQLAQDVLNSGTINEQEGWITGFDPTILQTAQTQAQTALEDYITNNMTNPTVGDVIGGRKTIVEQYPILAASLPNKIVTTGTRYDKLPTTLQQSVTYSFNQNSTSASLAWSTVNNEKVTLSFTPATPDDEAALQSLLPEGQITDINQLPASIPAYLINVIPELKVNGITKLTGNPMRLGEGLDFNTQIKQPGRSAGINYTYNIPAGSFVSVNTITGNVSAKKLTDLQAQLTQTKTTLETNDTAQIQNLTREDILGDMFYAGTLGYFAQLIGLSSIGALQAKEQFYLSAGYGTFGYEPKVGYFFGIPKTIEAGGVTLDIPALLITANNAGDNEKDRQFVMQSGVLLSTLEHATPEQMFNIDPQNPPNAFSAVKALQIASTEGQRIYQITQVNISSVMPNLNLDAATETEIQQAISIGKEVVAHTDLVSVPGYTGSGYVILDPVTGEGAYRISGGVNGGASSETGITDFVLAVVNEPGELVPDCGLPFIEQATKNFIETNKAIIGLAAPKGLTLLTGAAVAEAAGGFTLLTALRLSVKNASFLAGNLFVAIMTSFINTLLVNLWFEVGVVIGSGISAATCRRK